MLRHRQNIPLDYSMCQDTVTVYHREGLTRQVLEGVHFEQTITEDTEGAVTGREHGCLLVVPFETDLRPGDKIVPGVGGEMIRWTEVEGFALRTVQRRSLRGRFCHLEARG